MRQRALSLAVAIIGCFALVSASGAATTKTQNVTRIDVSTSAAVVHYLHAIHVNPKGVVIQRGLRNYAGAHCPGKGWTCASTRHTVVQIAKRGGLNRFACGTAKCAVVQLGGVPYRLHALASDLPAPVNTAVCAKITGITQSCTINQPNATGTNKAVVYMVTPKLTGLTQSASYTASITQGPPSATGSSNYNLACVKQGVTIDGSTIKTTSGSVTVTNDAHQSVSINQNSLTGNNTVQGALKSGTTKNPTYDCDASAPSLTQDETLTSTVTGKGQITQNQDTFVGSPNVPNVLLDIEQNQNTNGGFKGNPLATASNSASFVQTSHMTAIANTPKGPVYQTQSSPDDNPPYSGIVAAINQDTTGVSNASATQVETQCQDVFNGVTDTTPLHCDTNDADKPAFSVTQTQYGPVGIYHSTKTAAQGRVPFAHKTPGDSAQTGNPGNPANSWGVTQSSTQDNDTNSGQKNTIAGGITSSGTGTTNQNALIQGSNTIDVQDGSSTILCPTGKGSCTKTLSVPKITGQPDNPSFNGSGNPFTFRNADPTVTFYCSVDHAAYAPCTSVTNPTITSPPYPPTTGSETTSTLAPGTHYFSVATVDPANPNTLGPATATITWTILPLEVSALGGTDGSSAGWGCSPALPGGPIALTVGTTAYNPPITDGTFAQILLDDAPGTAIEGLPEPSFTTNHYLSGSPRFDIFLSDGNYLFGYPPPESGITTGMVWSINGTYPYVPWSDVQSFEAGSGATITQAYVVADGDQAPGTTDNISDLTFNGTDYNSGTCP